MYDTHFHIIDMRYPVQENQGFFPPSFPAPDYQARTQGLGITGGNVVSGSFQGFDTGFMHEALRVLGPTFTGVIQIPPTATDDEILKLDAIGVRGVRFNMARGGSADVADLENVAKRVWESRALACRTVCRCARPRDDGGHAVGIARGEHCPSGHVG